MIEYIFAVIIIIFILSFVFGFQQTIRRGKIARKTSIDGGVDAGVNKVRDPLREKVADMHLKLNDLQSNKFLRKSVTIRKLMPPSAINIIATRRHVLKNKKGI